MVGESIKIDVTSESWITKEVYRIVLESLLKYILYQCQQIPVQIDVLQGEIKKCDEASVKKEIDKVATLDDPDESVNPREHLKNLKSKILIKREENAKRNFERKRRRWLLKVQDLLSNYQNTMLTLNGEICNNTIKSTVFALGPSPLTAKYIFQIHAPPEMESVHRTTSSNCNGVKNEVVKRKVLLNLFRAFAGSSDLSFLTKLSFSTTKLWTLIEKESDPCSEKEFETSRKQCVSRPEFKFAPRAKVIEIFLKNKVPLISNEMILTPCVSKSTPVNLWSLKRPKNVHSVLSHNSNIYKSCSSTLVPQEGEDLGVSPLLDSSKEIFSTPMASSTRKPMNLNLKHSSEFWEKETVQSSWTPRFSSEADMMVETPVASNIKTTIPGTPSPIKRLALNMSECHFSLKELGTQVLWYQIEPSINGFRDVFLS